MNFLETMKNITKDKKRKTENLILVIALLVILLVAINYIFKDDNKSNEKDLNKISEKNNNENTENEEFSNDNLEKELEQILSKINGISEVSVMISYMQDSKQNIVYNTSEIKKDGESTTEKNVAYNEEEGNKKAIIESVETPVAQGAIIVAEGATSVDIKSRIASAVSAITNLPVYKIQVFEKGE